MTIPPFLPTTRAGRLYGRGSCDVKGGLAAMLAAFTRLADDALLPRPAVILSCTCDEEHSQQGVSHLVDAIARQDRTSYKGLPGLPDAVIVAEPTDLNVIVAHLGVSRWAITTRGRAVHSSRPQDGVNAIESMAEIVLALRDHAAELTLRPPHPLCGPPALSVGLIEGGTAVNIVPDRCVIQIDRRLVPGEDGQAVIRDVTEFLHQRTPQGFETTGTPMVACPLADTNNGDLARYMLAALASEGVAARPIGVPFGTHAARFQEIGLPAVVFGPGSISDAHTAEESIDLAELNQATAVLERLLRTSW